MQVTATDKDFGSNGDLSFRIGAGSRDNFVVLGNGSVYVSGFPSFDWDVYQHLDVDVSCRVYLNFIKCMFE